MLLFSVEQVEPVMIDGLRPEPQLNGVYGLHGFVYLLSRRGMPRLHLYFFVI